MSTRTPAKPGTTLITAREQVPEGSMVRVGDVTLGGSRVVVIAGPCSVENEPQVITAARAVKAAGASLLRGGAYKPRTSPYSFQGLRREGLEILARAREATGLGIVTEVMDARHLEDVARVADVLQVGSRNMQNFTLLDEVGTCGKPILLKRGMSATLEEFLFAAERVALGGNLEEFLFAAERVALGGNAQIILCERGIRTFETATRNTLDLNAVPFLKRRTHLPVIVDPSHGTGLWWMVPHMARAAVAVGSDGLIVEVHPHPEEALSDGGQSLRPSVFQKMMDTVRPVAQAVGRTL
jgi:3-deoxy-7-phosphoheptulonate synthase